MKFQKRIKTLMDTVTNAILQAIHTAVAAKRGIILTGLNLNAIISFGMKKIVAGTEQDTKKTTLL
jgi:hypothetical protein